ncbi:MAG TPA: hypothetical protein VHN74_08115 [Candidatus Angelobacter sp.]|jgi:hypothetical protein|nr:hypothetical protein [Candidatus Angelobacter sp.]
MSKLPILVLVLACMLVAGGSAAQAQPLATPVPVQQAVPASISLSPAVVMAKGSFGQGLTQVLTLTNNTGMDLAFELQAQDIVVKDGKRTFVAAGETQNGIAASAVFTPKAVLVKAHTAASVEVRLTIPAKTDVRAVSAIFMGADKLQGSSSNVAMTASLAALITFNLTDNTKLQQEPAHVVASSETANMTIRQWVANVGSEPVLPEGTAAVLNAKGALVGKATFPQQRLLPGERLEFTAEYPDQLQPGDYRALCSFQYEGKVLTNAAEFKVDANPK